MNADTTEDRYLLVSSDGHTGPPAEHYREYLEERYHPQFDAHQAELGVIREFQQSMNQDFRKDWEAKTGDGGLHAAYDSDARNERLDGEGVAAEVLFPDADVLGTGPGGQLALRLRPGQPHRVRRRAGLRRGPRPQPVAGRLLCQGAAPPHRGGGGPDRGRRGRRGDRDPRGRPTGACAG